MRVFLEEKLRVVKQFNNALVVVCEVVYCGLRALRVCAVLLYYNIIILV